VVYLTALRRLHVRELDEIIDTASARFAALRTRR
jgi:hypothetical protein